MSIKIAYICLKTLSIVKNIPLYATDGFFFTDNLPIKAYGDIAFIKKDGRITTSKNNADLVKKIELPSSIKDIFLDKESEPLYILPAV